MEYTHQTQHGLLEELLMAQKGDSYWTTFPGGSGNEIFPGCWNSQSFDHQDHNQDLITSNSNSTSLLGLLSSPALVAAEPHESGFAFPFVEPAYSFLDDGFTTTVPELGSSYDHSKYDSLLPISIQQDYEGGLVEDGGRVGVLGNRNSHGFQDGKGFGKPEVQQPTTSTGASTMGLCGDKKSKIKKVEGQPSKNLMAERRRRKRLNDRLSMLRSIVPKISKVITHLLQIFWHYSSFAFLLSFFFAYAMKLASGA